MNRSVLHPLIFPTWWSRACGNGDVTLSSSTGGTTGTRVVLVFLLLIGAMMLRRQFVGPRQPVKG